MYSYLCLYNPSNRESVSVSLLLQRAFASDSISLPRYLPNESRFCVLADYSTHRPELRENEGVTSFPVTFGLSPLGGILLTEFMGGTDK